MGRPGWLGPDAQARALCVLAGVGVAALAVVVARGVRAAIDGTRLPLWDMAAHALAGIHLADAARGLDLWGFATQIHRMAGWPPVFPLLECPVFLAWGADYGVAAALMQALFAATILAAFAVGVGLGGVRGCLVGAVTAALLAASPIYQQFGSLVMLEIPGALLVLLALAAYMRWARVRTARAWLWVCVLSVLLFLTKYNYGLVWMVALAIAWASEFGREAAGTWWRGFAGRLRQRRRFDMFVVAYVLLLAVIQVTGGWSGSIAGVRVSVRSIGTPVYLLALVCVVRAGLHPRASWRRLRDCASRQPEEVRAFASVVLLPIGLWLAAPLHMREFFGFVTNRSSGPPPWTPAGLLFYPRAFATDYSAAPALGWLVLAAAAATCVFARRLRPGERVVPLALLLGFAAATLHPYKDPRFLFTVAPFVWVCCGLAVAMAADGSGSAGRVLRAVVALGAVALALIRGVDAGVVAERHRALSVDGSVRDVLDRVADACVASRGTALLGTWTGLSPGLVEWHLRLRAGPLPPARLPRGANRYSRTRAAPELLNGIAADREVESLVIVAPGDSRWAAPFASDNPWFEPVRQAVRGDPRFELRCAESTASGYELEWFGLRRADMRRDRVRSGQGPGVVEEP